MEGLEGSVKSPPLDYLIYEQPLMRYLTCTLQILIYSHFNISRFLVDSTQTPNTKVKIAAMNHLISVAKLMQPGDLPTNLTASEQEMPLAKIITW